MADNHLQFKIGSLFNGEGFEAASKAINGNRQEIRSASAGLGELANAFGNIDPRVGQAVSSVKNFAGAFVSGGIVGGAIQLAIQGISKAVEFVTDWFKEAEARAARFGEIANEKLMEFATGSTARFKELTGHINEAKIKAEEMVAALNLATDSATNEKVFQIAMDKLQKITDDMTAAERAVVEAEAALATSIVKADASVTKASDAFNLASENHARAEDEYAAALKASRDAEAALNIARNERKVDEEKYRAFQVAAAEAEKNLTSASHKLEKSKLEEQKANEELTQAQRARILAEAEGQRRVDDATSKFEQETAAASQKLQAEKEKAAEAERKRQEAAAKEEDDWQMFLQKQREKLDEATGKTYQSFETYIDELDKAVKGLTDIEAATQDLIDGESPNKQKKTKNKATASAGVEVNIPDPMNVNLQNPQAIINAQQPVLQPFKDAQHQAREQAREQRDLMNDLNGKFGREISEFFRLLGTPASARSAQEQGLVDYYKNNAIPEMVSQLGVEMTAKLLSDNSRHVLMKDDFAEFFGSFNRMVKTFNRLGLK